MKAVIGIVLAVVLILGIVMIPIHTPNIGECTEYFCDARVLALRTKIEVSRDGKDVGTIAGRIVKFVTDPLTYTGSNGTKMGYVTDSYRLVGQDSHSVIIEDRVECELDGKFKLLGEKYDVYVGDEVGARATFNWLGSKGQIKGLDGKLWADYCSSPIRKDYYVRVTPNSKLSDEATLLIMASYFSDSEFDNSSTSTSSKSK